MEEEHALSMKRRRSANTYLDSSIYEEQHSSSRESYHSGGYDEYRSEPFFEDLDPLLGYEDEYEQGTAADAATTPQPLPLDSGGGGSTAGNPVDESMDIDQETREDDTAAENLPALDAQRNETDWPFGFDQMTSTNQYAPQHILTETDEGTRPDIVDEIEEVDSGGDPSASAGESKPEKEERLFLEHVRASIRNDAWKRMMKSGASSETYGYCEDSLYESAAKLQRVIVGKLRYGDDPVNLSGCNEGRDNLLEIFHKNGKQNKILSWPRKKRNCARFITWYNDNIRNQMTAMLDLDKITSENWEADSHWTLRNNFNMTLNKSENKWLLETINYLHWYRTPAEGCVNFLPHNIAGGVVIKTHDEEVAALFKKLVFVYALEQRAQ
uniref:Uncharacterized protein n=1 Tax=Aplanochytrium stocchinoi TaxID=215587 RepID=A0A7S3V1F9_9STRA|mmetsp:Transcript_13424/g.16694  ORF Transcript_13424/g.16694 Transcript_13424/m.16694 type:complete len:383 (+) Transcript_13424:155-1303(+)